MAEAFDSGVVFDGVRVVKMKGDLEATNVDKDRGDRDCDLGPSTDPCRETESVC